MRHIAEVEWINIRENLKNTTFLFIVSDGSTDGSVKEEELVYVRFCPKGKIESKFVGIKSVEKADAAHISNSISAIMEGVCDEVFVLYVFQIQSADAQNVWGVQQAKARKYYSTEREAVVIHFCGFLHNTLTHLSNLSAEVHHHHSNLSTAPCAQHRQ